MAAQAVDFPEAASVVDQIRKKCLTCCRSRTPRSKAVVMALKNRGVGVKDVSIIANNQLVFEFENGHSMLVRTDTVVVDWHWSFSEEDTDPYVEAIIACFHPSEKM